MPVPVRVLVLPAPPESLGGSPDSGDAATDVAALLDQAGLRLIDQRTVDALELAAELARATEHWGLVLVLGGAEVPEARVLRTVRACLETEWPGFGEAVRRQWTGNRGPVAVLVDAAAGEVGETLLVALPGPVAEARQALSELVFPLVQRLLPEDEEPTFTGSRVQLSQLDAGAAGPVPTPPMPAATSKAGWMGALAALDANLQRGPAPPLPPGLEALAPVRNVLDQAGERGTVTLADGRKLGVYGYPDLLRAASKVLLVGGGEPFGEVVALHRHPRKVGLCATGGAGLLPRADRDPASLAEELVGAPLPASPTTDGLFALDGATIYLSRGPRVLSWDGRRERDEGTARQAAASLLLRWSQR